VTRGLHPTFPGATTTVERVAQAMKLHADAFAQPRTPRSTAYVAGHLACLLVRADRQPRNCPHQPGTPEFDAWFAGVDAAHALANSNRCQRGQPCECLTFCNDDL
jgi:hypothetical protein